MQTEKPEKLPSIKLMRGIFKRAAKTVAAPTDTQPVSVGSSAWLEELEAALRHAENLKSISARENYWETNYSRWADGVMVYSEIEKAIERERSRSSNKQI